MTTPLNILIACGGTGGHLFPGIAVAQELQNRGHHVLLLISEKEVDAQASQKYTHLRFETIKAIAKPPTLSPKMIPFLWRLRQTINRCRELIEREKIDVVLGMGGFTSFPPVYAGSKKSLRTYVHDSNAIPGRSNLLTAKRCTAVLLGHQEAAKHFPNTTVIQTGTPVREELTSLPSRPAACQKFGLNPDQKTLLVMGGSQGALHLNQIVIEATANLPWQVLHLTGQTGYQAVAEKTQNRPGYHALAFCDDMPAAYAAADFTLARSGASSLTELSHVGLPALLVPYPYAADDHQTANALIYEKAHAALLRQQKDLTADSLRSLLTELDDPTLAQMSTAMQSLDTPHAAQKIANVIQG